MQRALSATVPGPKQRDGTRVPEYVSKLEAINYACVDQDVIIIHDPSMLKDRPGRRPDQRPSQIPRLDFSSDPYYFRQASQIASYDKLAKLGHREGLPPRESLTSTVFGYAFAAGGEPHNEIVVRAAHADEVKALSQPFSTCTTPLIFQSLWMHNLNEWMSRGPVAFHRAQTVRNVLPRNLSIVLHSPLKIPVPQWNIEVLKPFSTYTPISLADFSSRLPPSTPSSATAEGTHVRCFRRLLVWREVREERPYTAKHIGPMLLEYHRPTLKALDASEPPFWKSLQPTHMRVLVERRVAYGETGTRQFLHVDQLLAACNAVGSNWGAGHHGARGGKARGAAKAAAAAAPGGGSSDDAASDGGSAAQWTSIECVPHAFGKHRAGIVHDMWVMQHAGSRAG